MEICESDLQRKASKTVLTKKQHSLKDVILENNSNKKLPQNFFENVLDLELKLKREFTIGYLQELVNLYSTAIEYYESMEDVKYKDYQNRLNNLLSQPEILKKMNDFYTKKPSENDSTNVNKMKKLQMEQEKKQIKMKVNYITHISNYSNNNDQIHKIMDTILNADYNEDKAVSYVMNDELSKQQNNYRARIEEKRRRQTYSNFDMIDNINKEKKIQYNTCVTGYFNPLNTNDELNCKIVKEELENGDENCEKDEVEVLTSARTKKTDKTGITAKTETNKTENVELNLETSFEKFEKGKMNEIEEMFSPLNENEAVNSQNGIFNRVNSNSTGFEKMKSKDIMTTMFKINESLLESKNIGPKHKQVFMEIKQTLVQYVNEFNSFFYEYVFQRFTEHVQKLMDEKYAKYIEISKNYHSQIKEMEFLITGDSEDQHKEGIKAIIDSLKEEEDHELDRIEDHYNKLVSEAQANFRNLGFRTNPGIQLVEEKFKLDMYKLINSLLGSKK